MCNNNSKLNQTETNVRIFVSVQSNCVVFHFSIIIHEIDIVLSVKYSVQSISFPIHWRWAYLYRIIEQTISNEVQFSFEFFFLSWLGFGFHLMPINWIELTLNASSNVGRVKINRPIEIVFKPTSLRINLDI